MATTLEDLRNKLTSLESSSASSDQYDDLIERLEDRKLTYEMETAEQVKELQSLLARAISTKLDAENRSFLETQTRRLGRNVESAAVYDLTHTIGPYLDRHMVFPLLEFLETRDIYSKEEVLKGKLSLVSETNLVDFAIEIEKALSKGEEVSEALSQKRASVIENLGKLEQEAQPILHVLGGDHAEIVLNGGEAALAEAGIHAGVLDAFYRYARAQFNIGRYSMAAEYLRIYQMVQKAQGNAEERCFSAHWGELAAEILAGEWDVAFGCMMRLRDAIESRSSAPAVQLQQRTWLMHWSLFVFFNHPNGRNGIVDLFLQDKYLNAIQTECPHLLRYLSTAVITNKRRRNAVLKQLVVVLQQEHAAYRDPITEFLQSLYVHFDFDGAQHKLKECEKLLANDYFLFQIKADFMESARLLVFETYCRIHKCVDLSMLAEKLSFNEEEAERWIVNLIRNARLDAKIDSANNQVVMGSPNPSIYQQVIEKTKVICFRTYVMANNL